ncbi:MAG: hypothetical protein BAJATHORv1_50153 [Candidatus Thorarchaeota archaeon]|nr:MAG: hypothetical protein BAJATHORv1_50153 [Candidatus Thorarchaeota archaeon]
MVKTALVTGCAGFIASHLTDKLLEKGFTVIGIDNLSTGIMENLPTSANFEFHKLDITEDLSPVIEQDLDYVFHLAAISSVKLSVEDPLLVNKHNTIGTLNVLNLAKERDARRFVFSSSAAVYGNPDTQPITESMPIDCLSPYAASKASAEKYIQAYIKTYSLESTLLRYFNVYGPRQAYSAYSGVVSIFINDALQEKPLTIDGDGTQTRSMIHVNDVVDATIRAAEVADISGEIINICGTEVLTILEIAKKIADNFESVQIIHGPPRAGDVKESFGSLKKAKKLLDFEPTIPFETGLEETIKWYRERFG